jgi:hypothetical protein
MIRIEIDHIDPSWKDGRDYQLICGLDVPLNFCEREEPINIKKSNRFLPWRVSEGDLGGVPVNPGDLCQFLDLDTGAWVLEEFMGDWWFEKTKKICGQSAGGTSNIESGHLKRISPLGSSKGGKRAGKKMFEEKKGLFAPGAVTFEMRSYAGRRAAEVTRETGTGLYGVSVEVKRENGVKTMAYKYVDPDHPELGLKPAPVLVRMQKSRGYPHGPDNRVRVE